MNHVATIESSKERPGHFIRIWLVTVVGLMITVPPFCGLLLHSWPNDPQTTWLRSLWPRKFKLAARVPAGKRLVIVSGSSGLFSLDAQLLQERFQIPALNLGTHAALGLRHLLNDARATGRPGDVMLLYLEDAHYRRDASEIMELEQKVLWTNTPARLTQLPWPLLVQELYCHPIEDYQEGWQRRNEVMRAAKGPEVVAPAYSAMELSPQGDYRGRAPVPEKAFPAPKFAPFKTVKRGPADELTRFVRWCRKRQIQVIAALPGTMRPASEPDGPRDRGASALREFYDRLTVPFIHIENLDGLPRELMLDTPYHASTAGRRIITEAIAGALIGILHGSPSSADAPWLLVKSPHAILDRELVLGREGVSGCRFLAEDDLQSPLCIRPAEVAAARLKGTRFVFADPEIQPLLQQANLSANPIARKSSSLSDWIAAYPRHLFALVAEGGFDTSHLGEATPDPFRSFLASPSPCKVALLGTGPYADLYLQQRSGKATDLRLSIFDPRQKRFPFPISLFARSTPDRSSLVVDHIPVLDESREGLHVAVIDPETGLLIKHAVFSAPTLVEWQLQEVQLPAR